MTAALAILALIALVVAIPLGWLFLLINQIFELHHFAGYNGGLWSSVLRPRWKLEDAGLLPRFE